MNYLQSYCAYRRTEEEEEEEEEVGSGKNHFCCIMGWKLTQEARV